MRPHVVVLEDMHWCDPATEDWVLRLADGIAAKRALLLLSCRPGYRPPAGDRSFHTGLALSTLSDPDTLRLAQGLLASDDLPPALQALIVEKAEGNPFFVEELMRSLLETGAVRREGERVVVSSALDRLAVPDTIEATILARAQRLDDSLRRLLEVASVIGRAVPFPLLRAVSGLDEEALAAGLRRLQAAEFLYETKVFPELEHTFKHALTQDVAYAALPPTSGAPSTRRSSRPSRNSIRSASASTWSAWPTTPWAASCGSARCATRGRPATRRSIAPRTARR